MYVAQAMKLFLYMYCSDGGLDKLHSQHLKDLHVGGDALNCPCLG